MVQSCIQSRVLLGGTVAGRTAARAWETGPTGSRLSAHGLLLSPAPGAAPSSCYTVPRGAGPARRSDGSPGPGVRRQASPRLLSGDHVAYAGARRGRERSWRHRRQRSSVLAPSTRGQERSGTPPPTHGMIFGRSACPSRTPAAPLRGRLRRSVTVPLRYPELAAMGSGGGGVALVSQRRGGGGLRRPRRPPAPAGPPPGRTPLTGHAAPARCRRGCRSTAAD
jgi:hypothetical protein